MFHSMPKLQIFFFSINIFKSIGIFFKKVKSLESFGSD